MSGIQCLTDRHIPLRRRFPIDAIGFWCHRTLKFILERAKSISPVHRKKRPFAGSSELARVVFLSYGPQNDTFSFLGSVFGKWETWQDIPHAGG